MSDFVGVRCLPMGLSILVCFQAAEEEGSPPFFPLANNSSGEFGNSSITVGGAMVSGTTSNSASQPDTGAATPSAGMIPSSAVSVAG